MAVEMTAEASSEEEVEAEDEEEEDASTDMGFSMAPQSQPQLHDKHMQHQHQAGLKDKETGGPGSEPGLPSKMKALKQARLSSELSPKTLGEEPGEAAAGGASGEGAAAKAKGPRKADAEAAEAPALTADDVEREIDAVAAEAAAALRKGAKGPGAVSGKMQGAVAVAGAEGGEEAEEGSDHKRGGARRKHRGKPKEVRRKHVHVCMQSVLACPAHGRLHWLWWAWGGSSCCLHWAPSVFALVAPKAAHGPHIALTCSSSSHCPCCLQLRTNWVGMNVLMFMPFAVWMALLLAFYTSTIQWWVRCCRCCLHGSHW